MLFLAAGLLVAVFGRRHDEAAPYHPPAARPDDGSAVVLDFPNARGERERRKSDSKANRG